MRHVDKIGFLLDIEMLCHKYHGSVTSWIRSEKRNEQVGGTENSFHLIGYAVDVVFDTVEDRLNAMEWCRELGYDRVYHRGHLHIEADPHLS